MAPDRPSIAWLIVTIGIAVALAGCGGTSPSVGPSTTATDGVTSMERLVADQRAFDGRTITVMGSLIEIGGTAVLCSALAEVFPDGCSPARLVLVGAIPPAMMGQTVTVTGTFRAERGPAAMRLEIHEIRPTGA